MNINAHDIPHDGYWTVAGQVFSYPLVTVFAADQAAADAIAGPDARNGGAYLATAMDSAEASNRLGTWGRPDLAAQILRGDQPPPRMANGQTPDEGYAEEQADYEQADYEPGEE